MIVYRKNTMTCVNNIHIFTSHRLTRHVGGTMWNQFISAVSDFFSGFVSLFVNKPTENSNQQQTTTNSSHEQTTTHANQQQTPIDNIIELLVEQQTTINKTIERSIVDTNPELTLLNLEQSISKISSLRDTFNKNALKQIQTIENKRHDLEISKKQILQIKALRALCEKRYLLNSGILNEIKNIIPTSKVNIHQCIDDFIGALENGKISPSKQRKWIMDQIDFLVKILLDDFEILKSAVKSAVESEMQKSEMQKLRVFCEKPFSLNEKINHKLKEIKDKFPTSNFNQQQTTIDGIMATIDKTMELLIEQQTTINKVIELSIDENKPEQALLNLEHAISTISGLRDPFNDSLMGVIRDQVETKATELRRQFDTHLKEVVNKKSIRENEDMDALENKDALKQIKTILKKIKLIINKIDPNKTKHSLHIFVERGLEFRQTVNNGFEDKAWRMNNINEELENILNDHPHYAKMLNEDIQELRKLCDKPLSLDEKIIYTLNEIKNQIPKSTKEIHQLISKALAVITPPGTAISFGQEKWDLLTQELKKVEEDTGGNIKQPLMSLCAYLKQRFPVALNTKKEKKSKNDKDKIDVLKQIQDILEKIQPSIDKIDPNEIKPSVHAFIKLAVNYNERTNSHFGDKKWRINNVNSLEKVLIENKQREIESIKKAIQALHGLNEKQFILNVPLNHALNEIQNKIPTSKKNIHQWIDDFLYDLRHNKLPYNQQKNWKMQQINSLEKILLEDNLRDLEVLKSDMAKLRIFCEKPLSLNEKMNHTLKVIKDQIPPAKSDIHQSIEDALLANLQSTKSPFTQEKWVQLIDKLQKIAKIWGEIDQPLLKLSKCIEQRFNIEKTEPSIKSNTKNRSIELVSEEQIEEQNLQEEIHKALTEIKNNMPTSERKVQQFVDKVVLLKKNKSKKELQTIHQSIEDALLANSQSIKLQFTLEKWNLLIYKLQKIAKIWGKIDEPLLKLQNCIWQRFNLARKVSLTEELALDEEITHMLKEIQYRLPKSEKNVEKFMDMVEQTQLQKIQLQKNDMKEELQTIHQSMDDALLANSQSRKPSFTQKHWGILTQKLQEVSKTWSRIKQPLIELCEYIKQQFTDTISEQISTKPYHKFSFVANNDLNTRQELSRILTFLQENLPKDTTEEKRFHSFIELGISCLTSPYDVQSREAFKHAGACIRDLRAYYNNQENTEENKEMSRVIRQLKNRFVGYMLPFCNDKEREELDKDNQRIDYSEPSSDPCTVTLLTPSVF